MPPFGVSDGLAGVVEGVVGVDGVFGVDGVYEKEVIRITEIEAPKIEFY